MTPEDISLFKIVQKNANFLLNISLKLIFSNVLAIIN